MAKAKIALAQAEVDLDHATLVAPVAGTVASMPFTRGSAMTSSDALTIVGAGSVQLTTDVAQTAISQVEIGQKAQVSTSTGQVSAGTVTAIAMLPADSTTSSTAAYPVTVTIPEPGSSLAAGVTATVSITVATAKDAVLLPVSAVTRTSATGGTVRTLGADHQAGTVPVVLGVTGPDTVQITSGLAAGQQVVLADTTTALPTSNTSAATRRTGAGAAAPGTGMGGAGAPPGGAAPGGR